MPTSLEGTKTKLLDTRKTTPGLRVLEKYAVAAGGGINHRMGLSDMVLIKDNHLLLVPGIAAAVAKARGKIGRGMKIEVEVTSLAQARQAVEAGADMIMLDNMAPARMREVVAWVAGRVPIEASGRIDLKRLPAVAATGVDFVSVGRLTHSAPAADISLEFLGPLGHDRPRLPLDGLAAEHQGEDPPCPPLRRSGPTSWSSAAASPAPARPTRRPRRGSTSSSWPRTPRPRNRTPTTPRAASSPWARMMIPPS